VDTGWRSKNVFLWNNMFNKVIIINVSGGSANFKLMKINKVGNANRTSKWWR
jgi:hypothetical protein